MKSFPYQITLMIPPTTVWPSSSRLTNAWYHFDFVIYILLVLEKEKNQLNSLYVTLKLLAV